MDDRFKNAMDAVEPDESIIKRLIESEVSLFRHALTLLCWGLVFTSFVINIPAVESQLYATWIGCILMTLSLWMLRSENRRMTVAFRCGAMMLILRVINYWLGAFPSIDGSGAYWMAIFISIASYILMLTMLYCLFSGLRDLALRFKNEDLAKRLMRCFGLYISLYLLIFACLLIPFLVYPLIPYALYVLIKLPATVGKLKQYVPLGHRATTVKAISKWVWLALCLYIVISIGGEFGCLYYVSAPNPDASVYVNKPSTQTYEIREKLYEFGMPEYVLNDLPDDEVLSFEGIYRASSGPVDNFNEITNRDGGKLEVIGFAGFMPGGKVRVLFYYRWLELPKHAYTDLLSLPGSMNGFVSLGNANERGMALYDKDGKTYCQTPLNDGALTGSAHSPDNSFSFFGASGGGLVTQIQFRLYPQYTNQRGYVALTMQIAMPETPYNFNYCATYVHQESLWNRPHFNTLNNTSPNGYSSIQNYSGAKAFWSQYYYGLGEYEPEDWEWTEEAKDWSWSQVP